MVYFKNPKSRFRVHTWLPISITLYYLLTWTIHKLLKAIFSSLMIASRAPAMKAHKDFFSLKKRKLPKNYSIHAKKCIGYQKPPSSCTRSCQIAHSVANSTKKMKIISINNIYVLRKNLQHTKVNILSSKLTTNQNKTMNLAIECILAALSQKIIHGSFLSYNQLGISGKILKNVYGGNTLTNCRPA